MAKLMSIYLMSESQFTTSCHSVINPEESPGEDHLPFSVQRPLAPTFLHAAPPVVPRGPAAPEPACLALPAEAHIGVQRAARCPPPALSASLRPASGSVMAAGCHVALRMGAVCGHLWLTACLRCPVSCGVCTTSPGTTGSWTASCNLAIWGQSSYKNSIARRRT